MIPALPLSALGSSGDITDTNLTKITYMDKQTGTDSTDSNGNRFRQAEAVGATRVETDQSKLLQFTVPMGFRTIFAPGGTAGAQMAASTCLVGTMRTVPCLSCHSNPEFFRLWRARGQ